MQHRACGLGCCVFSRCTSAAACGADSLHRHRHGNLGIPYRRALRGRGIYGHHNAGHQCVLHGIGMAGVLLVELGAAFVLLSFDLQAIPRYTRAADGRGRAFGRAVIVLDSHTDYQHGLLHIPSGCSCGSHAADRVFLPAETQVM